MLREQRRSSPRMALWGGISLLGLLSLMLAACGGPSSTKAASVATPTATVNTKGAGETFGPTPLPYATPPYAFPATWHNARGLTQLNTSDPTTYAFAPSDGRIGYLCGATPNSFYVTHDGGDTWQALHTTAFGDCASIFIDAHDASDLFSTSSISYGYDLWRSRDGGATWSKLGGVTDTGFRLVWVQVAVIGSRLIGEVNIDQEGFLQNDLYVSGDGGLTWKPFAQNVADQGYTLSSFTLINSAIYITSQKGTSPGGMAAPIWPTSSGSHSTVRSLDAPLSGQPPTPPTYWRSDDGGATWRQVTLPGVNLIATPRADGQGSYLLSTLPNQVDAVNQQPIYDETMWWSADSGATWKRLPDLRGIERGYVIGGSAVALAPDGSVFASAQHDPAGRPDDAGVFRIQPSDAAPAWQPLVAGGTQANSADMTPTGLRFWGIGASEADSYLKYVNVA